MDSGLKNFGVTPSGRASILHGAKFMRGFIVRPEQMLSLLHDTQPGLPIPKDAQHKGIGVDDSGTDSKIQFYFTSQMSPTQCCIEMRPDLFLHKLVELSDGLLPLDSELDGIEISHKFTVLLFRVKSSHWPAAMGDVLPLYHLRYEMGILRILPPSSAIEAGKLIKVTDRGISFS